MPFEDDATLEGDLELLRVLVDRNWITTREDGSECPSSAAFVDSLNESSCFLLNETDLHVLAVRFPGKKVGIVTARAVRQAGFIIARDDAGGDGIAGHVVLIQKSVRPQSNQHIKKARELARTARMMKLQDPNQPG